MFLRRAFSYKNKEPQMRLFVKSNLNGLLFYDHKWFFNELIAILYAYKIPAGG